MYVAGRVSAFGSYAFGDAYPPAPATGIILPGGGIDDPAGRLIARDLIPRLDPATGLPDLTQQGTISKMRVRSGALPNILTIGVRRKLGAATTLTAQLSFWGTIEPMRQEESFQFGEAPRRAGRDKGVEVDFREGYLDLEGPWGSVRGGRFISPFSRGNTETMLLYGYRYGIGVPVVPVKDQQLGSVAFSGPTGGLIGYGVLGATYAAGVQYTSPSLAGFRFSGGVFEPVMLNYTGWTATRTPRPEAEGSYDLDAGRFKMKLFGSAGYQKLWSGPESTATYGFAYGGRFEFGPVRVGGGGHTGKGVGITYAFDGSETTASGATTMPADQLRSFQGYSAFAQVAVGPVDLQANFGRTQVPQLAVDVGRPNTFVRTQTAIGAAVVYHMTENLHLTAEFVNASIAWWAGQTQKVNFLNAGATMTF